MSGVCFMDYLPAAVQTAVAAGTNTADLAPYLQQALAVTPKIVLPPYNLALNSTVILNNFNTIEGVSQVRYHGPGNGQASNFVVAPGVTAFQLAYNPSSLLTTNVTLRNIGVFGGATCLNLTPQGAGLSYAATYIQVLDSYFSPSGAGTGPAIVCSTAFERCEFRNLNLGGTYGFQMINNGNATGNYFDKSRFESIDITALLSGINIAAARPCNDNLFSLINLNFCGQGGWYSNVYFTNLTIINAYTEGNSKYYPGTYDDFYFAGGGNIAFVGGNLNTTSQQRYSINNGGCAISVYGTQWGGNAYDPGRGITMYGAHGAVVTT